VRDRSGEPLDRDSAEQSELRPVRPWRRKGALYRPDAGPAPHIAVLLIHRTANFLAAPGTRELTRRGVMVLAMNPRSDNNESTVNFETVALWGHSGGGPATTFYQARRGECCRHKWSTIVQLGVHDGGPVGTRTSGCRS
jgi:hypothetical protein